MRVDLYLKVVLTVIAVCLIWLCLGKSTENPAFANNDNTLYGSVYNDVKIALDHAQPFRVTVEEWNVISSILVEID
jgi:hypothetical protein